MVFWNRGVKQECPSGRKEVESVVGKPGTATDQASRTGEMYVDYKLSLN